MRHTEMLGFKKTSRLLHPLAYALNWQWTRSIVFAVGMLACLTIMIGALW